jgi:hypothetical protein
VETTCNAEAAKKPEGGTRERRRRRRRRRRKRKRP